MDTTLNKQPEGWVQEPNSQNPTGQAWGTPNEGDKYSQLETSYKSLESEYTRTRQLAIDTAVLAGEANAESILKIPDKKVQDAVVKRIYGYNSLSELQAIEGNDFYKEVDDNGWNWDEVTKLSKVVKQLQYTAEARELENSIEKFKLQNKDLFNNNNADELIREELKYITSELAMDERVKRAANNVLGSKYDPTSLAYKAIASASSVQNPTNINNGEVQKKNELEQKQDSLRAFWGLPINK